MFVSLFSTLLSFSSEIVKTFLSFSSIQLHYKISNPFLPLPLSFFLSSFASFFPLPSFFHFFPSSFLFFFWFRMQTGRSRFGRRRRKPVSNPFKTGTRFSERASQRRCFVPGDSKEEEDQTERYALRRELSGGGSAMSH